MGAAGEIVTVVFFAIWGKLYGALHLGTRVRFRDGTQPK